MGPGDYILLAAIGAAVAAALVRLWRQHRRGGCCYGCKSCSDCRKKRKTT